MKIPIINTILIVTLVFTGCGGSQNIKLENKDALQIEKATYQRWVAGVQGGGAGYNVQIELKELTQVKLDSVYFKDFAAALVLSKPYVFRAFMDDGKNLMQNQISFGDSNVTVEDDKKVEKQHLFELSAEEAILVYREEGKKKYYKLALKEDKNVELPR